MTILIFIIILAVLILSHEFGHFIVAKKTGMKVEEFGLGFPPRLFGVKRGETMYSINLIPFGGFVKIEGEEGEHKDDPKSFAAKPAHTKAAVLAAGVFFNILLAYLLFSFISWAGTPMQIDDETPEGARNINVLVGSISASSPADTAGLEAGDIIRTLETKTDRKEILFITDVQIFVEAHKGEIVNLTILRGGEERVFPVLARLDPPSGEGAFGVSLLRVGVIRHSWYRALWEGAFTVGRSTYLIISGFYEIIRIALSGGNTAPYLAGPIGIVSLVRQSLDFGFLFLLQFTAILSVHLAIINLVPFPALDGGRLFFLLIEAVIRRPLPRRFTNYANTLGFFILIGLMILISVADVKKLL